MAARAPRRKASLPPRRPAKAHDPLSAPAGQPMRSFDHSLPMALLRAREAVMAYFRPLHRQRGVTEQQWRVIRALYDTQESDITTLADRTCLLMPSLSRILRQLEKSGLVARRVLSADQRRSMISLSRPGRDLVENGSRRSEEQYAEITRRYGAEKLRTLYRLLGELDAALTRNKTSTK
jgi:homoprotocatechuate degradation regulator HpaR